MTTFSRMSSAPVSPILREMTRPISDILGGPPFSPLPPPASSSLLSLIQPLCEPLDTLLPGGILPNSLPVKRPRPPSGASASKRPRTARDSNPDKPYKSPEHVAISLFGTGTLRTRPMSPAKPSRGTKPIVSPKRRSEPAPSESGRNWGLRRSGMLSPPRGRISPIGGIRNSSVSSAEGAKINGPISPNVGRKGKRESRPQSTSSFESFGSGRRLAEARTAKATMSGPVSPNLKTHNGGHASGTKGVKRRRENGDSNQGEQSTSLDREGKENERTGERRRPAKLARKANDQPSPEVKKERKSAEVNMRSAPVEPNVAPRSGRKGTDARNPRIHQSNIEVQEKGEGSKLKSVSPTIISNASKENAAKPKFISKPALEERNWPKLHSRPASEIRDRASMSSKPMKEENVRDKKSSRSAKENANRPRLSSKPVKEESNKPTISSKPGKSDKHQVKLSSRPVKDGSNRPKLSSKRSEVDAGRKLSSKVAKDEVDRRKLLSKAVKSPNSRPQLTSTPVREEKRPSTTRTSAEKGDSSRPMKTSKLPNDERNLPTLSAPKPLEEESGRQKPTEKPAKEEVSRTQGKVRRATSRPSYKGIRLRSVPTPVVTPESHASEHIEGDHERRRREKERRREDGNRADEDRQRDRGADSIRSKERDLDARRYRDSADEEGRGGDGESGRHRDRDRRDWERESRRGERDRERDRERDGRGSRDGRPRSFVRDERRGRETDGRRSRDDRRDREREERRDRDRIERRERERDERRDRERDERRERDRDERRDRDRDERRDRDRDERRVRDRDERRGRDRDDRRDRDRDDRWDQEREERWERNGDERRSRDERREGGRDWERRERRDADDRRGRGRDDDRRGRMRDDRRSVERDTERRGRVRDDRRERERDDGRHGRVKGDIRDEGRENCDKREAGVEEKGVRSRMTVMGSTDMKQMETEVLDTERKWNQTRRKCSELYTKGKQAEYESAVQEGVKLGFDVGVLKESVMRARSVAGPEAQRMKKDIVNHYRTVVRGLSEHRERLERMKKARAVELVTLGMNKIYIRMFCLQRVGEPSQRRSEKDALEYLTKSIGKKDGNLGAGHKEYMDRVKQMVEDYCTMIQVVEKVTGEDQERAGNECAMQ